MAKSVREAGDGASLIGQGVATLAGGAVNTGAAATGAVFDATTSAASHVANAGASATGAALNAGVGATGAVLNAGVGATGAVLNAGMGATGAALNAGAGVTGAAFDATASTVSRVGSALYDAGRSAPLQSMATVVILAVVAAMSSRGMAKRYQREYAKGGSAFDQTFLLWVLENFVNSSSGMLYGLYHDTVS